MSRETETATATATETATARLEDLLAHADWLRRLAARLVREGDADDLVQDTWAAALAAPPRVDRPAQPWLATVLRNFGRKRWRDQRIHDRARPALSADEQAAPSPHELLERAQLQRVLAESVVELEEPYRSTILLRYYEGKTAVEIARRERIAEGTVRWRLSEGIQRLRRRLDERHGGNRQAWVVLLAPAGAGVPAAGGTRSPGLMVATGSASPGAGKLAVAAAVLVLAAVAIVAGVGLGRRGDDAGARAHRPREGVSSNGAPRLAAPGPRPEVDGVIAGVVVGPGGRGVAGATVAVLRQQRSADVSHPPPQVVRAGAGGVFRVGALVPGAYTIAASAAGLAGAVTGRVDVSAGTRIEGVVVAVAADVVTVAGRLLDTGGGPVPAGRVRAMAFLRRRTEIPETHAFQADADGRGGYRIDIPAGRYALTAWSDGYSSDLVVAEIRGPERRDFRLQPAARLSGRVVTGADRAPVAGAEVRVQAVEAQAGAVPDSVTTDDTGHFRIPELPPGSFQLTARRRGLVGAYLRPVTLAAAGAVADLEIAVSAGLTIGGAVRSSSGIPVRGARVRLRSAQGRFLEQVGPLATGRYLFQGLLPGEYRLDISAEGHVTEVDAVDLRAATTRDLVLAPTTIVEVRVLTAAGEPAGGAQLDAFAARAVTSGGAGNTRRAVADGQGRVTLDGFGDGDLTLIAQLGDEDGRAGPLLLAGGERKPVTIRLRRGARVSGVVTWDDGTPAAGAHLTAFVGIPAGPHVEDDTGADGSFTMGPVTGDDVIIWARGPSEREVFSGAAGQPDNARLGRLAPGAHRTGVGLTIPRKVSVLAGVVVAGATGEPLAGVPLRAVFGRHVARAVSGPGGAFTIDELFARPHTLLASYPGYADAEQMAVAAGRTDLRILLRRGGTLAGTVVARDGRPVAAYTLLVGSAGRPGETSHRVDDVQGAFRIEGIAPGAQDLVAVADDGKTTQLARLEVREGEVRERLRLVADGGVTVIGRAVDAGNGRPIPEVRVHVELGGVRVAAVSDAAGAFVLGNVPALSGLRARLRAAAHHAEVRVLPPPSQGPADLGTIKMIRADPGQLTAGRLGVTLVARETRLFVEGVEPGSPAAVAGFRIDDELLSIAGHPADGDARQATARLHANPGTVVPVVLRTPGQSPRGARFVRMVP
jgi:RNA polymerase sigma factor (sigma-70 family)